MKKLRIWWLRHKLDHAAWNYAAANGLWNSGLVERSEVVLRGNIYRKIKAQLAALEGV